MVLTQRIALKPTKEQEALFWKWSNTSRFIYNYSLDLKSKVYKENDINLKWNDIVKHINLLKIEDEYKWIAETPSETIKYAIKDMDSAFKKFFQGGGYPKFKKKSRTTPSFYTRYDKLYSIDDKHIKICGIKTPVRLYEICLIPSKPLNPRIKYDGKYWYLTYGMEISNENVENPFIQKKLRVYNKLMQQDYREPLGIDLGITNTAICSNGKVYKNINKTPEIKRLEKKKKRLQQQLSRKYLINKDGHKFIKTKNINKLEKQLKLVQRRINNIRNTYNHQLTSEIVKTKPSKIIMEDLKISNMMKNRYLAKSIQEQNWYTIRLYIKYKSELYSIPIKFANTFYPSSKTCSRCGCINKNIKLSDRTFTCTKCNLEIDRDYNASINLSKN